jgi:hypothetical protein
MKSRNLLVGFHEFKLGIGIIMFMAVVLQTAVFAQLAPTGVMNPTLTDQQYLSQMRNNQVSGNLNPADVLKAREQSDNLRGASAIGLNWSEVGPDNFGGRTRSLIIDNRDQTGKTIFAGSVAGGVWKSTTEGLTWTQISTGGLVLNVSTMSQAPNGDIYVGTGENFSTGRYNKFDGFIGQGIFKSTDGNNFSRLNSTNPGTFNNPVAEWAFVNKVAAGDNKVIAATNNGLKYSSDGGQTWTMAKADGVELTGLGTEAKISTDGAIAAVVDYQLYVSVNGAADGFKLRSTGTGNDSLPNTGIKRIEVAFAPSDPSVLYAVLVADGTQTAFKENQMRGVFVSKDKGVTWRMIGPGGSNIFNVFGNAGGTSFRGEYAVALTVDPANPDRVLLGGVNVWTGLKMQEDGFYNWVQRSFGEGGVYFHNLSVVPSNPLALYMASDKGISYTDNYLAFNVKSLNKNYKTSMFYSVASDDKGHLLGGAQGNGIVYIDGSGNSAEAGVNIIPMVDGQARSIFTGGTVEISLIQPLTMLYSTTGGELWRSPDLGVSVANDFLYGTEVTNLNANVFNLPFRLWESFNNIYSRDSVSVKATENLQAGTEVTAYSNNNKYPFRYKLTQPLQEGDSVWIQDKISSIMFIGTTNAVYMSRDVLNFAKIPSWDKIAELSGVPTCMAYSSDANNLFVGTQQGQLLRISNLALAYDSIRADVRSSGCIVSYTVIKEFEGRYITSIAVDPNNSNTVIVTLGNYGNNEYVFRTTNSLDQTPVFTSMQGNLPAMPVYSSLVELNNSSRLIIGTDFGIYTTETLSNNPNWTAENEGMGSLPVMMIRQQTVNRPAIDGIPGVGNFGAIYIASYGNGLFENRKFVGINEQPWNGPVGNKSSIEIFPNPVNTEMSFALELNAEDQVSVDIFNFTGQLIKHYELGMPGKGRHVFTKQMNELPNGTYLLRVVAGKAVKTGKFIVSR